jgi:hypothetical protein
MKVEKVKADVQFALIEEHFYGTRQLVLKSSCCGKDTTTSYVAGVNFTLKDLVTFGVKKKVKGCQIGVD